MQKQIQTRYPKGQQLEPLKSGTVIGWRHAAKKKTAFRSDCLWYKKLSQQHFLQLAHEIFESEGNLSQYPLEIERTFQGMQCGTKPLIAYSSSGDKQASGLCLNPAMKSWD